VRRRRELMIEHTLETVTRRLDRLEGENRWLKGLTLMLLLAVAAMGLMGQTAPHRPLRALEAEEFLLRDSRGQVRASLGTTQNPSATGLQIHNANGKPRTRLTLELKDGGARILGRTQPRPDLTDRKSTRRTPVTTHSRMS